MQLPNEVKLVIQAYAARFPVPSQGQPVSGQDWTHRLAEQLAYSFPGKGYGHKSAGPGRPHSGDAIAQVVDGRLFCWDLVIGMGTGSGQLNVNASGEDITGQVFEAVTPVNHLGASVPQPPPQPQPDPGDGGGSDHTEYQVAVIQRLDAIYQELQWQRKAVEQAVVEVKKGAEQLQGGLLGLITQGLKIRF